MRDGGGRENTGKISRYNTHTHTHTHTHERERKRERERERDKTVIHRI
jgi:hypothetical protein